MSTNVDVYTSSSIECFATCPRKYQLKYEQQWEKEGVEAAPLFFGKLAHAVAEMCYWRDKGVNKSLENYIEGGFDVLANADPYDIAKAEVLGALAYEAIKEEADDIVASEGKTSIEFHSYNFDGRYDLLVRIGEYYWIVDYKFTTGIKPREYWINRPQGDNYLKGLSQTSYASKLRGVIWVNVSKPTTKPVLLKDLDADGNEYKVPKKDADGNEILTKTGKVSMETAKRREYPVEYAARLESLVAEEPEKYISVVSVKRTAFDIARTVDENDYYIRQIDYLRHSTTPVWPRNPSSCEKFNKMCEFCEVCTIVPDEVIQASGYIKREHKHAELTSEEETF